MAKVRKDDENLRICLCCGTKKSDKHFYLSKSFLNKAFQQLPWCKDCVDLEYENLLKRCNYNVDRAIYYLCMKLDIPFSYSALEAAKKQSESKGTPLNRVYIQKINSFREVNGYGDVFLDGEQLSINTAKSINEEQLEYLKEDIEVTPELIRKWGNLPKEDIIFLEEQYIEWCTRYDVSTKSMEILVQEICYQQLNIKKKRERGESVSKELKDLQDLMNSAALKPVQESAAMGADVNTLGMWIKKFENEKPIPEPDPEFKDVDGISKYIRVWFLGHLCRMLGIENEYAREYEEELMKYTVDINEEESIEYTEGTDTDIIVEDGGEDAVVS